MKPYRQIIKNCDDLYNEDSPNWLGWLYPTPMLNFRDFSSQEIFALVDRATLEKTTNQIAEKALCDITFVLERIKNTN